MVKANSCPLRKLPVNSKLTVVDRISFSEKRSIGKERTLGIRLVQGIGDDLVEDLHLLSRDGSFHVLVIR